MRFASVPLPKSEPVRSSPAAEFVRRLLGAPKLAEPQPADAQGEPPADLDQRVRLVGEW